MIHARQVQHAVQHQDAHLVGDRVAELRRLLARAIEGNGDLARHEPPFEPEGNDSTSVA